jgi:ABC-type transporter Mla subunit MlaD
LAGIGAFVLGGLALFAVALFLIGDRQMAFATKFTVYTEFKKITGLQPGGIVRVSGAKAGSITQILPPATPNEKFRVKLELTETSSIWYGTDSVASIETEGLVGGSYLGIAIGTDCREARRTECDDCRTGTVRDHGSHGADGRHRQEGERIVDALTDDMERAVVGIADTADDAKTLLAAVSGDLKQMAASGAKLTGDVAEISEGLRSGKGSSASS